MPEIISLILPGGVDTAVTDGLRSDLAETPGIASVGATSTRALDAAGVILWVGFAANLGTAASSVVDVLLAIRDRVQQRKVRGVVIELPTGITVSLDSATPDEIARIAHSLQSS